MSLILLLMLLQSGGLSLSLPGILEQAGQVHPLARRNGLYLTQAEAQAARVRGGQRPQVWLEADAGWQSDVTQVDLPFPGVSVTPPPQERFSVAVKASQKLFDGGIIRNRAGVETASGTALSRNAEAEWQAFRAELTQLYFQILLADARLESQTLLVKDLIERHADLEKKVKSGVVLASGAWVMEAEWLRARQLETELRSVRRAAVASLNRLLNTEYPDTMVAALPDFSANAAGSGPQGRAEWKAFDAQEQLARARTEITEARNLPQVNALATAGYGRPGLNMFNPDFAPFMMVGLNVRWQMFDGSQLRRERQALTVERRLIESRREVFQRAVAARIVRFEAEGKKLDEQLVFDAAIITLKENIVAQFTTRFNNGAITSTELVNELTALYQARLQQSIHHIQRRQVQAEILLTLGVL